MLLLKDAIAFDLGHGLVEVAPSRPLVVAMSHEGRISLCSPGSATTISRPSTPANIRAVRPSSLYPSLHPSKPLLALVDRAADRLLVLRFDGTTVFECSAPQRHVGAPDWAGYHHCHFDATGAYLWCSAGVANDKIEVELREADSWSVVSQEILEGPFDQGSSGLLFAGGGSDTVALSLAEAGGCSRVYWVVRDGDRFRCVLEPALVDTLPLVFAPGGREFLVADVPSPIGAMRKFRYPPAVLLAVGESPFGEDDPFDYPVRYLDDRFALANTLNNRIVLLDTSSLRFVKEVVVEGHEPRPVEEHFPGPAGAESMGLCGDISFDRTGDYLAVLCPLGPLLKQKADGGLRLQERPTRLLFFPISYVLERECA
jgi:hypothetical protein